MRVLHIVNAYPSKGNLVRGIFIKEQIDSIAFYNKSISSDVLFIDSSRYSYLSYFFSYLKLLYIGRNFDVIHAHHVFCAFICISSGFKKKLVTSYLSDSHNEVMIGPLWFRKFIFNFVFKHSSKSIFKILNSKIDNINNFYCPNAVNLDFFHNIPKYDARLTLGLEQDKHYALFISGQNLYRPEKRYDLFLDTIELYNKTYKCNVIPIALDKCDRENLVQYYNAVDFYLLTSDFEGSPNAVKECLACDTPVISRAVGSTPLLLSKAFGSYLVDSDIPSDFIDSIHLVLNNRVSISNKELLLELQLHPKVIAERLFDIYLDILK